MEADPVFVVEAEAAFVEEDEEAVTMEVTNDVQTEVTVTGFLHSPSESESESSLLLLLVGDAKADATRRAQKKVVFMVAVVRNLVKDRLW